MHWGCSPFLCLLVAQYCALHCTGLRAPKRRLTAPIFQGPFAGQIHQKRNKILKTHTAGDLRVAVILRLPFWTMLLEW